MDLNVNVLGRRAAYEPDRPAVFFRNRWYSYGELYERALRAAGVLSGLGVERGDRVGLLCENHIAYLDLFFGCPLVGASLSLYNTRLTSEEISGLIDYTSPRVVFCSDGFRATLEPFAERVRPLEELETGHAGSLDIYQPDPEETALLLFTGGTTGLPKAAMISHRQLLMNAFNTVFSWGLRPDDGCIVSTPMFHAAINALAIPLLYLGGRVLIQERFEPGEYLEWLKAHEPSLLFMVPTMFHMLSTHQSFPETDLACVRWGISGGAPCPPPVREAFEGRGVSFRQGYGLTEAGVNCFALDEGEASAHPESVGRPILHMDARLVRDGEDVAQGEVGELWLAGPVLMSGYYERPDATAEVLIQSGGRTWLRTGDLARRDADGRYFIVGRQKEMFISGGENVYPPEIERVLVGHPDVDECAVVGVPHPRWGEVGLAAVTPRPGARLDTDTLQSYLRERLARYKVPKKWVVLEELPKSGAGKILKREIGSRHGGA